MLKAVSAAILIGSTALGGLAFAQSTPTSTGSQAAGRPPQAGAPAPRPNDGMRGPARGMGGGMGLARMDTDGDGRVTRAEYDAQSAARFGRMDANRDGIVDATEMAAMPGGGRMGPRADGDGSGTLSRAEFDARARTRFDRIDVNGDGLLDAAEMNAERGMRGGRRGDRPAAPAVPNPTPPAPNGG